jgi:hypothetical protein
LKDCEGQGYGWAYLTVFAESGAAVVQGKRESERGGRRRGGRGGGIVPEGEATVEREGTGDKCGGGGGAGGGGGGFLACA